MRRKGIRALPAVLLLLPAIAPLPAQTGPLPAHEAAAGWVRLFDGETLNGWAPEEGVVARAASGVLELEPGGGWLRTFVPFADLELSFQYLASGLFDSGVYLRVPRAERPAETGFEVQLTGQGKNEWPAGSVVGYAKAGRGGREPSDWRRVFVRVVGSEVEVQINGRRVAAARVFRPNAGFIGLQAPAGGTVRYRDIRLRPLGLAPLFNGRDLSGWRAVEPEPPSPAPAEWSVREGLLHAARGPGQLETQQAWDDFVLQAEIRVNTVPPAPPAEAGILFRADPGILGSGYRSVIHNAFRLDPRNVAGYGTGGIDGRAVARAIVARDGEWFVKTILASGRNLAVWVNGYLVTAYTDPSPQGTRVSEGKARLARGVIALQAPEARASSVNFRYIRIR